MGERLERSNNFDALRLFAAALVIFSHAYPLGSGPGNHDPLYGLSAGQWDCGDCGVAIFFVISGYLITGSYLNSRGLGIFLASRCLRIFPGLATCLLLTMFFFGPLLTELPLGQYFSQPAFLSYATNLGLHNTKFFLPGVFTHNVYPGMVNGSLWTLEYEFAMYLVIAAIGFSGLLSGRTTVLGLAASMAGMCVVGDIALRLSALFFAGAALYYYRKFLTGKYQVFATLVAIVIPMALLTSPFLAVALVPCLAILVIQAAFARGTLFHHIAKYGDLSYGVYIYAFLVQQIVTHYWGGKLAPGLNFMFALPGTLLLAWLSWHLVERPALGLKSRVKLAYARADLTTVEL